MNKEDKLRIKELKKEKRYNEIYAEFGQKAYLKNMPSKIQRKELRKLSKEGKFIDIYNKYGEEKYNNYLAKAEYRERKDAKGKFSAIIWDIKRRLGIVSLSTTLAAGTLGSLATGALLEYTDNQSKENAIKYASEIEAYNNKINEYAKEVQSMNLTDVQVFMKVTDDMWGSIKGYKSPEKDLRGYLELDLADEDGYGVCRNMASDVARKLNAINPEYNARTMTVYVGEDGWHHVANVKRNIIEENNTVAEEKNEEEKDTTEDVTEKFDFTKYTGNHEVTLIDIKEDNLILVLDPTNPGIGIYKDGDILMLDGKDNLVSFDSKEYTEAVAIRGGLEGLDNTIVDYIRSFGNSKVDIEEIRNRYGIEAQNRALEEVRQMSLSQQDKFRDEYKVDVNQIDNELDKIEQEREMQKIITNVQQERQ